MATGYMLVLFAQKFSCHRHWDWTIFDICFECCCISDGTCSLWTFLCCILYDDSISIVYIPISIASFCVNDWTREIGYWLGLHGNLGIYLAREIDDNLDKFCLICISCSTKVSLHIGLVCFGISSHMYVLSPTYATQ